MCKGIMSENITRNCTGRYYYSQKGQKDQKSTLKSVQVFQTSDAACVKSDYTHVAILI